MRTQIFLYENLEVYYRKIGSGSPLLFLHGWGVNSEVMLPLAQQFAEQHTCYLVDLPGFGQTTEPPKAWSVADYTDLIEQFIGSNIDESTDIIAHSFGGRITLKLCARSIATDQVNRVLITGGAGMKPKRSVQYYVKKYLAKALKTPFKLLPEPQREKSLQKLRQTWLWQQLGSSGYSKLTGVMRKTFVRTVTEYLEPCLPHIPHETLLLWGRNDTATPLYQAKRMETGIDNAALVVIENAAHYAFLDQPQRFTTIAKAFIDENG